MVTSDFYKDFAQLARDTLIQDGFVIDTSKDEQTIMLQGIYLQKRAISMFPRQVHRANDLWIAPEFATAIDEIERKVSLGEALKPHLSKELLKLNFHDRLLNDWGLHHFHLDTIIDPNTDLGRNGFTNRTGSLLFAYVTHSDFYMVAIKDHSAWTDKDLLETILSNWSYLLEGVEMPLVGLSPNSQFTEKELQELRKSNVVTCVQLSNGKVYAPLGGGIASSGDSVDAVSELHHILRAINRIERDLSSDPSPIYDFLKLQLNQDLDLKLVGIEEKQAHIQEQNSRKGFSVPLYQQI